jgi:hypothetical protein
MSLIEQFFQSKAPLPFFVVLFFLTWVFFIINCFGYNVLDDFLNYYSFLWIFHYLLQLIYLFIDTPVMYLLLVFAETGLDFLWFKILFFLVAAIAQGYGFILLSQQMEEVEGIRYFVAFVLAGLMFVCFLVINSVEVINHVPIP